VTFDVTITAPANHIISKLGELTDPSQKYTPEQLNRWALAAKATRQLQSDQQKEIDYATSRPNGKSTLVWHFKIKNARDVLVHPQQHLCDAAKINLPSGKNR
jgi:hypothetical protein